MPHPITRIWNLMFPIPHWILNHLHMEKGLIVRIKVSISAHHTEEVNNIFGLEILFAQYLHLLFPHHIGESRIVFRDLWPNHFYQEDPERAGHTLCRVSLTRANSIRDLYTDQHSLTSILTGDEPPHQIHSYTLLFSLFLCCLYIIDPPLHTSTLMRPHALAQQSHLLHQTNLAYLMDT